MSTTYPKSPKEMTKGMMYFPRMLGKIRLHQCGDLHEDYHQNFGGTADRGQRLLQFPAGASS
jgi:hypothetical protein